MYSEDDLASAVKHGALSEEAAQAFRRHVAGLRSAPLADEEQFRFISSFNDLFVAIGCALLLSSMVWIAGSDSSWLGPAALSACAWALAEFFTRKRRMAFPSIFLLLGWLGGVTACAHALSDHWPTAFACAGVAAWLHWRRFRVPITAACGAAAITALVASGLMGTVEKDSHAVHAALLACGVASLAWALWWDASDPLRRTSRSDVAFWLHLLAAPLLVHSVIGMLGLVKGAMTPGQALGVITVYVVITVASLAIDRRALMVSALVYVLYASSTLLDHYQAVNLSWAFTALFFGSLLLALSAFWSVFRVAVLRALPEALGRQLPPLAR